MSEEKKDRELGMKCPISRRDFLNGVAVGVGGALAGETLLASGVVGEEGGEARGWCGEAVRSMLAGTERMGRRKRLDIIRRR